MKEFEKTFNEGLRAGLRKFKSNPLNKEGLLESHNWMPMKKGLKIHESITSMEQGISSYLLLENGDYILLETGDKVII